MLIDVKRATLLVVDVQDKLLPAIDQHEALQESLLRLVGAAVDAGTLADHDGDGWPTGASAASDISAGGLRTGRCRG